MAPIGWNYASGTRPFTAKWKAVWPRRSLWKSFSQMHRYNFAPPFPSASLIFYSFFDLIGFIQFECYFFLRSTIWKRSRKLRRYTTITIRQANCSCGSDDFGGADRAGAILQGFCRSKHSLPSQNNKQRVGKRQPLKPNEELLNL